jgi:hypothetical protein
MGASQWINTLTTGPERDAAVNSLVVNQGQTDPGTALGWATTISGDATRMNAYRSVMVQMARRNPGMATTALAKLQLTDDQRKTLTDLIAKTPAAQAPNPDMYTN